ncbi:MAG: NAD+ synthase [Candidatus Caldarchaeum sp.]|nr:NAD+ synthase [Candidatus Caldarchaeum sp.]MCX8200715.1 NAD+ synthase [Candidatus Caldarchaeum sp.]MDW8063228.1 NAD+ synthase [Candidatus Caldarchaeum sp.]MDW8434956.1 NAD+ synthase [Candidatus Caldarchaeum sp.]
MTSLFDELYRIDYDETAAEVQGFIVDFFRSSNASGVVVGLSGGLDSSVVATLCVKALSKEKVLGLIMPTDFTPTQDVEDAKALAQSLGIKTITIPITPIVNKYADLLGVSQDDPSAKIAYANLRARVRMSLLYFHANHRNMIVAGTGDRSEILLGYYTKYGDGGVDFLPVGGIYKTQLRRLCRFIGVPEHIAQKPSSPQLYPGHRAVDELPADYDVLDPILYALHDRKLLIEQVVDRGFERKVVEEVWRRFEQSHHKRTMPPTGPRPVPIQRIRGL